MTLMAHVDCKEISDRSVLDLVPHPQPVGPRHVPIPHNRLVKDLTNVLDSMGFTISRERFALSGPETGHKKLFATFDLESEEPLFGGTMGRQLGLKHSNGGDIAVRLICGERVFVCDNGVFSGDAVVLNRKHTSGLQLIPELEEGLGRWLRVQETLEDQIERAIETNLSTLQIKQLFWDVFANKALPARLAPAVNQIYFEPKPEWTDVVDHHGTLWGAHNALTRSIRDLPLRLKFDKTQRLGKLLEPGVVA